VGLLVTGYYAGQTLAAVPAGALVDRLGVGRSLVLAAVLLALGCSR
jgi:fucose permease